MRNTIRNLAVIIGLVAATVAPAGAATQSMAEVSGTPAQSVQGFGASGAWWVNDLAHFAPAVQQRVGDLLFGPGGLALSVYRYNVGGGGVGVTNPPRAPQTVLVSPGTYDWTRDPGGSTFLQLAAQHGVSDLQAFVNSAPPVWTNNGKSCGGWLVPGNEDAYGRFLADVVTHFAQQGVHISEVSPLNEPDNSFADCGQEGMQASTGQRGPIVRALGKALAQAGSDAQVLADETSWALQDIFELPQWAGDASTQRYLVALAHHTYDFPTNATMNILRSTARNYGKPLWATEICCSKGQGQGMGQGYDPGIDGGLRLADLIHQDLTEANDAQFDWWTALSPVLGCDPVADPGCPGRSNGNGWNDGLIYYDQNYARNGNQSLYVTKRFWALANFSRFVRPGALRFPIGGMPGGVWPVAFEDGGKWTVVAINDNTAPTQFPLHFAATNGQLTPTGAYRTSATEDLAPVGMPTVDANNTLSATLPARSITTFTFSQPTEVRAGHNYVVQSAASGSAIDVSGASTSDSAAAIQYHTTGEANQRWTVQDAGSGQIRLVSVNSGKCLDLADGAVVIQYGCNGGANQAWTLADGRLRNASSGKLVGFTGKGDGAQLTHGADTRWTVNATG
ncbi:glycoside hydrolase [Kutzneria albida]|uniref:glycoside hydrolase n=1 Tax=Kutzneria albida TaxID=43357 RepID=UPI00046D7F30|nr:glycoside hydrolase [Kutzneria albida]